MRPRRCAEIFARKFLSSKKEGKATFYSLSEEWIMPATSTDKPREEREFVENSRASMHMVSRKDLNSAKLDTVKVSQNLTTVVTANGEVLTKEEATVYVRELDLLVTVMLLEDNTSSSFTRKTLRRSRRKITIGPVVRNHISSRKGKKIIATHQIMYHSSYLVYPQVLLPHQLRLHLHRRKL